MSAQEYNFQVELKKAVFTDDVKVDRKKLVVDIFKSYVAKLFEIALTEKRLPYEALVEIKNNIISEFRSAELSEYQKSVEQYEDIFDSTVKEIMEFAATRHGGTDVVQRAPQNFEINGDAYVNEGGLYLPKTCVP